MKIFLFGVTSAAGTTILQHLLEAGYDLKIQLPSTAKIFGNNIPRLQVAKGGLQALCKKNELADCRVVVFVSDEQNNMAGELYSPSGITMLATLKEAGVRRLLIVTPAAHVSIISRIFRIFSGWLNKGASAQKQHFEERLEKLSGVTWINMWAQETLSAGGCGKYFIKSSEAPVVSEFSCAGLGQFIVSQVEAEFQITKTPLVPF